MLSAHAKWIGDNLQGILSGDNHRHNLSILKLHLILLQGIIIISLVIIG